MSILDCTDCGEFGPSEEAIWHDYKNYCPKCAKKHSWGKPRAGRPKSTTALGNNVLIRISAELKKQLEEEATKKEISFSAHCREILAAHCRPANH